MGVIAIHVVGQFSPYDSYNWLFWSRVWVDQFARYAIPLFFLISGFVLHLRYSDFQSLGLKKFYLRRISSVMPPYVIFTVLYWVYNELNNFRAYQDPLDLNLSRLIRHLVFSDVSMHFWFFAVLFQFYLLYPLLFRVYNFFLQCNSLWLFLSICFLIQILDHSFNIHANIVKWVLICCLPTKLESFRSHISAYPFFLSQIFYFVLGIFLHDKYDFIWERLKRINGLVLLIIILFITTLKTKMDLSILVRNGFFAKEAFDFSSPTNMILNLLVMMLFFWVSLRLGGNDNVSKVIGILGENSFGIYLVHGFFLSGILNWFGYLSLNQNQWFYCPIFFMGTLFLSNYSVEKLSRLNYGRYFIGVQRKK